MAVALPKFSDWLGNKLKDLNTDENVFGDYITGILDGDETSDEKSEALQDLLCEIVEDQSINELCTEIMDMWLNFKAKEPPPEHCRPIEVDIKLKELAEKHCLQTKQKQYSAEEKKIREAILAQYSQTSDDEDGEEVVHHEGGSGGGGGGSSGMQKNTNAYNVAQAEKEKRENARADAAKKKEKDKEDREKQKQMKEDKKEKRKTVKGERRR